MLTLDKKKIGHEKIGHENIGHEKIGHEKIGDENWPRKHVLVSNFRVQCQHFEATFGGQIQLLLLGTAACACAIILTCVLGTPNFDSCQNM